MEPYVLHQMPDGSAQFASDGDCAIITRTDGPVSDDDTALISSILDSIRAFSEAFGEKEYLKLRKLQINGRDRRFTASVDYLYDTREDPGFTNDDISARLEDDEYLCDGISYLPSFEVRCMGVDTGDPSFNPMDSRYYERKTWMDTLEDDFI